MKQIPILLVLHELYRTHFGPLLVLDRDQCEWLFIGLSAVIGLLLHRRITTIKGFVGWALVEGHRYSETPWLSILS